MTRTGFGRCSVSIVWHDKIDDFRNRVSENYFEHTGLKADFYVATAGNGAGKLKLFIIEWCIRLLYKQISNFLKYFKKMTSLCVNLTLSSLFLHL